MSKSTVEQRYHLFPFNLVKYNSEIILYGYGSMWKQYAEQISKSGYCNVKYIVDKRWKDFNNTIYPVRDPEILKTEKNAKIVITTDRYANEIKRWLLSIGVNNKNIITENIELDAYSMEEIYISDNNRQFLKTFRDLLSVMEVLPKSDFVRIGRNNDGGYLMIDDFLQEGGIAYSFGICDDVSWDKDMAIRGYSVFMYDHTIDDLPEQNDKFFWVKKGVASSKSNIDSEVLETLEEIIKKNKHTSNHNMILKMDVEGSEWGCLDMTSSETLLLFDQILLEIHECIQFQKNDLILKVLKKISKTHQCVHVHINNFSNHMMVDNIPYADCYEVTFLNRSKYSFKKSIRYLPHDYDQPCNPRALEIVLGNHYNA